jgi:hypothetical protein
VPPKPRLDVERLERTLNPLKRREVVISSTRIWKMSPKRDPPLIVKTVCGDQSRQSMLIRMSALLLEPREMNLRRSGPETYPKGQLRLEKQLRVR